MLNRILANITARRKPPKKVLKPTGDGQVAAASQHGELLEDYDEGPVPSYPPFQHGIPAASVRQVMETQSQLIQQIKEQLGLGPREWDRVVEPMLVRYAEIVHLLPASEAHHHRGAGGLFRHGLEAGFWACRSAENKIFTKAKTPMLRRGEGKRWEVAALTAGLTHDVGKTICDVAVIDRDGLIEWNPHQPLAQWLAEHKLRRYFLHWNSGREHKRHESFSVLFMAHIIQGTTKAYLLSHPEVMDQLLRVVSGQGEDTEFGKVVLWADRQSVSRDLKHQRISPDEFAYGVPVEKYVLDALRSLIGTKDYQPNKPPFAICVSEDGVYLKWHDIVGAILAQLRKDDIRGVPSNPDTLARLLIERGLATGRPAPTPDAPDAYYLYHELKPRAKGLAALAKHEVDKYLLIHDPDMVFPSTALPQTMEVELKPVEQGRAHSPKGGERTPKDGTHTHAGSAHVLSGDSGQDGSKEAFENDTAAEGSCNKGAEGTDPVDTGLDDVGSHITFEELLSGELGGWPSGKDGSEDSAEVKDHGEAQETAGSPNERTDTNSSQAAQWEQLEGNAEGPDPLGSHGLQEAMEGGQGQSPGEFDLNALILEQVGPQAAAEHSSAQEDGSASMEIPDFLKTLSTSDEKPEEDDGIEYEDVELDGDKDDRPSSEGGPSHQGVNGNSQQGSISDLDEGNSASKPTLRVSAKQVEANLESGEQDENDSGPDAQPNESGEAQNPVSADEKQPVRDGSSQVARVVKVLESEDATPRELLAENDLRLIKKREHEERFQKRRKKKLEKASKSSTDQFDIDATLAAKKRGRDITLEDIRARKSTSSELAKTAKVIGVYIPGLDPDEDAAVTSRKIVKEQIQLDQVDSAGTSKTNKKERVDIGMLIESEEVHAGALQSGERVEKKHLTVSDPSNKHAEEEENNKDTLKPRKPASAKTQQPKEDGGSTQHDVVTGIESGQALSVSKSEIVSLYQKIQQDMMDKTRCRLPDIEVTLIADSIIHAIATRTEPLGQNAYISEKGRLLIRYPEGLAAHLPGRPRTRDTARLAREMQQAALVSHLSGGRAQDGPVQRDPETGEMVLAFTIAINKLVQKLFKKIEACVEAGERLPHFSKLTHKDQCQYESARKEIQSSIDKQLSESMREHVKTDSSGTGTPGDGRHVEGSIERAVSAVIKAKRSALQNKEEASSAVINVMAGQIAKQNGSLIEDAPIVEKGGAISVQESIVTRAAKAANNKYVTASGIRKTIRRYGGSAQIQKSPHGVEKVVLRNGRLYIFLKGDS